MLFEFTDLNVLKDGNTLYNELEVVEGMKLDRGYISPYFMSVLSKLLVLSSFCVWYHFCSSNWNGVQVCAVKAPGFGENRKANLQDLAILTGGEVGFTVVSVVHFVSLYNSK